MDANASDSGSYGTGTSKLKVTTFVGRFHNETRPVMHPKASRARSGTRVWTGEDIFFDKRIGQKMHPWPDQYDDQSVVCHPPRKKEMDTCAVCVESYGRGRSRATCPACDFDACRACVRRYLLQSDAAQCMKCAAPWDRATLHALAGSTWTEAEYAQRHKDQLFQTQRALFAATQPLVQYEVARERHAAAVAALDRRRNAVRNALYTLDRQRRVLQNEAPPRPTGVNTVVEGRTMPCAREGCVGYAAPPDYVCGVCMGVTCHGCHAYVDAGQMATHVCDEAQRMSVRLMNDETRRCPGCKAHVQKTGGCDQVIHSRRTPSHARTLTCSHPACSHPRMSHTLACSHTPQMFCSRPGCATLFSWSTMAIDRSGRVHNPEAVRALRRGGALNREHGDIPCGGAPTYRELRDFMRRRHASALETTHVLAMCRAVGQASTELTGRTEGVETHERAVVQLRVDYLRGKVDEDAFKRTLLRYERRVEKRAIVSDVLRTFMDTVSDLLRQAIVANTTSPHLDTCRTMVTYTNEQMIRVHALHKGRVPCFVGDMLNLQSVIPVSRKREREDDEQS